jgi:hypothetical protein
VLDASEWVALAVNVPVGERQALRELVVRHVEHFECVRPHVQVLRESSELVPRRIQPHEALAAQQRREVPDPVAVEPQRLQPVHGQACRGQRRGGDWERYSVVTCRKVYQLLALDVQPF